MLIHSTFLLLKHTVRPMDMIAIDTIAGRVHSFLSVTWGMVADIDIESERFRNLGNARFTLEAISRIISKSTYIYSPEYNLMYLYIILCRESKNRNCLVTYHTTPTADSY